MNFLIGLMTVVLVVDCALLILVILIQLPKKEAGLGGAAFATGATDALFGAGTGNMLTKITKYAAALFLILSLTLYVIEARAKTGKSGVDKELEKSTGPAVPAATGTPATQPTVGQPAPITTFTNTGAATNTTAAPAPGPRLVTDLTNPPTAVSPAPAPAPAPAVPSAPAVPKK